MDSNIEEYKMEEIKSIMNALKTEQSNTRKIQTRWKKIQAEQI